MLEMLETRLDNVVYLLGFGQTRAQARQMVVHGHILVNGKKVTIPSYVIKVGDTVDVKDKVVSRQLASHNMELSIIASSPHGWVSIKTLSVVRLCVCLRAKIFSLLLTIRLLLSFISLMFCFIQ
jgi:ribosomal protein S4